MWYLFYTENMKRLICTKDVQEIRCDNYYTYWIDIAFLYDNNVEF